MPADKTKTEPPSSASMYFSFINIHEKYEVAYGTKKFGVRAAIAKVGVSAAAVDR